MKSDVIIVSGPPAAGKTYIGTTLASLLSYPLITKDEIKEILYDIIGTGDRDWSRQLGKASAYILHYITEQFVQTKTPLIIESAFYTTIETPIFESIIKKNSLVITQIFCHADHEILLQRFETRQNSSNRHKGHQSPNILTELQNALNTGRYSPLKIPGKLIRVNTNDIENFDVASLIEQIE